jgi:hypothetical protein
MQCTNCGKKIPDNALMCRFCEAHVEPEPTEEEAQGTLAALDGIDPKALQEFLDVMRDSKSADEFANRILVGDCPKCGSEGTESCENDPDVENILVGRCPDCGHLWCTLCGRPYEGADCECWDELEEQAEPAG